MKTNIQIYVDPHDSRYVEVWVCSDTGRNEKYRVRRTHQGLDKIESAIEEIRISAVEASKRKKEREAKELHRLERRASVARDLLGWKTAQ